MYKKKSYDKYFVLQFSRMSKNFGDGSSITQSGLHRVFLNDIRVFKGVNLRGVYLKLVAFWNIQKKQATIFNKIFIDMKKDKDREDILHHKWVLSYVHKTQWIPTHYKIE